MRRTFICLTGLFLLLFSCQQEEVITAIHYSDDLYELKEYQVERHPPVVRNGFGMDIYHEGDSGADTCYLASDTSSFAYDLKFYNEFAYTLLPTGDYSNSGYPVIFMYTDTLNKANATQAAMVGQGIDFFTSFTADSITTARISLLKSDPYIRLADYRTEVHTTTVDGFLLMEETASELYARLVIGHKFRPNIGGVFTMADVSDEAQIYLQPVFLIKTREGLYAKFMVTRFKGLGTDTQKLTLRWQAIKK